MNLTLLEKVFTIFKYTFSSFLAIELFLFSALLFIILIVNMKRKEKVITYSAIVVYMGLLIGTMIAYRKYLIECVRAFAKVIVSYVCFPTTVAFFFTIAVMTLIMIYTLFSKKLGNVKKVFNYLTFSICYFFFMSFIAVTAYGGIKLDSNISLYSNNYVLVLVQASNVLLLIWAIVTIFYRLYLFFKEKFD